jgi:hypothetical protein
MQTTFEQKISTQQWARLAVQVWQCDGRATTGPELAQLLLAVDTPAFPIETIERSPIGVVIRTGTKLGKELSSGAGHLAG